MTATVSDPALYGLLAEFDSAQALLDAAQAVSAAGYTRTDAFSPFPVHGLADALKFNDDKRISRFVLTGGICGALAGYGLEYWTQAVAYPLNIGGRPFHAWAAFIPPAFETTILFAAFTAGISDDRVERPAAALPSGLQRGAFQPGQPGQVLPRHRSRRSEVRPR